MPKQTARKNIKMLAIGALVIVALGVVGQADSDYENRPSVCREYNGSAVCYQP